MESTDNQSTVSDMDSGGGLESPQLIQAYDSKQQKDAEQIHIYLFLKGLRPQIKRTCSILNTRIDTANMEKKKYVNAFFVNNKCKR